MALGCFKLYYSLTLQKRPAALIWNTANKEFFMRFNLTNSLTDTFAWIPGRIRWLALPVIALLFSISSSVQAQPYVNVTIGGAIAPGVYGQIAIGNNPPPPVVNPQPVIVGQPVYGAAPMYLYVPPEHQRDWARYCASYRACGHPVHFVRMEEHNRWWEHRNEHLRGPDHYLRPEARREEREHEERRERR
jgi:hypothetical protein